MLIIYVYVCVRAAIVPASNSRSHPQCISAALSSLSLAGSNRHGPGWAGPELGPYSGTVRACLRPWLMKSSCGRLPDQNSDKNNNNHTNMGQQACADYEGATAPPQLPRSTLSWLVLFRFMSNCRPRCWSTSAGGLTTCASLLSFSIKSSLSGFQLSGRGRHSQLGEINCLSNQSIACGDAEQSQRSCWGGDGETATSGGGCTIDPTMWIVQE